RSPVPTLLPCRTLFRSDPPLLETAIAEARADNEAPSTRPAGTLRFDVVTEDRHFSGLAADVDLESVGAARPIVGYRHAMPLAWRDRKSTRLNSSHVKIS